METRSFECRITKPPRLYHLAESVDPKPIQFRARGHDAWSNDLVQADDGSPFHFMCDYREVLALPWDLMIAHPVCTFLTNSAVRWMDHGRNAKRMRAMRHAAGVYAEVANAEHIPLRAIENPVMHSYARAKRLTHPSGTLKQDCYTHLCKPVGSNRISMIHTILPLLR